MLLDTFANCALSSTTEEKEDFKNQKKEDAKSFLVVVLYVVFYIAMVLLVAFVGTLLWNSCLVPATTCVKKVTIPQLLGVYFLVRFFLA